MSFAHNTIQANDHFSSDYQSAREKFLAAAKEQEWKLAHYPLKNFAAEMDTTLSCDVAIGPVVDTDYAVIVSSGLHGVEGFFGSAVQHAWIERYQPERKQQPRMIFLHALNPYGFAMLRRCDAENIDVNRNFVLDPTDFRGHHPLYARLDALLNPQRPPSRFEFFRAKTLVPILRFGYPALLQALAEGQYDFPKGLFFGGQRPSWTRQLLEQNLTNWIGECSRIVHIDFHTGLGKWGTHQLLVDYTPMDVERQWLHQHLGSHRPLELSSRAAAYVTRGSVGAWCRHHHPGRHYIYACAEFGTCSQQKIIATLRRENQAYHWAEPDDPRTQQVKNALKDAFCPPANQWRQVALQSGLDIIAAAVDGLPSLTPIDSKR